MTGIGLRVARFRVNTAIAMNEYSSVLIVDMALPDMDAPGDMALQNINMMSFGGMEQNQQQWRKLIQSGGLVFRKCWSGEDGAKYAVVEAILPSFKGVRAEQKRRNGAPSLLGTGSGPGDQVLP
jgi:hypothetical protein